MKTLYTMVSLLIILYIVQCVKDPVAVKPRDHPADPDSAVVVLDNSNFGDTISKNGLVSMVEFYSPTCGNCIEMIDIVDSLAKTFYGTALVGKVNGPENDSLANEFGVELWPTFIFFRDGKEYDRYPGRTSFDNLAAIIQSGIDGQEE